MELNSLPDDYAIGFGSNASGSFRASVTADESFYFEAWDCDGAAWTRFITVTSGDNPTCGIRGASFNDGSIDGSPIGQAHRERGWFTELSAESLNLDAPASPIMLSSPTHAVPVKIGGRTYYLLVSDRGP